MEKHKERYEEAKKFGSNIQLFKSILRLHHVNCFFIVYTGINIIFYGTQEFE